MAKNDHFHEGRKVGRNNAIPIKMFLVIYYDLKPLSLKFNIYILIGFELPR